MANRPFVRETAYMRPIGLIFPVAAGPVAGSYVPLDAPLTALYGLNGAGKSYVLDALRACLLGIRPSRGFGREVRLLAAVPDGYFSNLHVQAWDQLFANDLTIDSESVLYQRNDLTRYTVERHWERFGGGADFPGREELMAEIAQADTWLFEPTGSYEPAWNVTPATVAAPGSASHAYVDWLDAANDWDEIAMSPIYPTWWDKEVDDRPSNAPIVLDAIAASRNVSVGRFFAVPVIDSPSDPNNLTSGALADHLQRLDYEADQGDPSFAEVVESVTRLSLEVESAANGIYAKLLPDGPTLSLAVGEPYEWVTGSALTWSARRFESEDPRPIGDLSQAERRWATIAISLALSREDRPILLIDEPEAALHRSAENGLIAGLTELAASGEVSVVAATHSPILLDSRVGEVFYVRRRSSEASGTLVHLSEVDLAGLDNFGLLPSDLLRRIRGFLLVEGEHDLAVLEGAFGQELKKLGVEILPLRGASKLKDVVDSRFLFDFTDALLFPMLDDIDVEIVTEAWETAKDQAKTHEISKVVEGLVEALKRVDIAHGYYQTFLTRALQRGLDHRVVPLGVSLADILLYLPVDRLVSGASNWDEVRREFQASNHGEDIKETKFKEWLKKRKHSDLSSTNLRNIAATSTPRRELKELLARVAESLDPSPR